jgi:glycosyltransferase involved in cell wall biosynthesis
MRIAQVAPLAEAVPPKFYGGTERIVSYLTEALVEFGHDVTLFASGDSVTRAHLIPVVHSALRLSRPRTDAAAAHTALLRLVAQSAHCFDVIHCHTDWLHLAVLHQCKTPFLTTLHGRLDIQGLAEVTALFRPISAMLDRRTSRLREQVLLPLPGLGPGSNKLRQRIETMRRRTLNQRP